MAKPYDLIGAATKAAEALRRMALAEADAGEPVHTPIFMYDSLREQVREFDEKSGTSMLQEFVPAALIPEDDMLEAVARAQRMLRVLRRSVV